MWFLWNVVETLRRNELLFLFYYFIKIAASWEDILNEKYFPNLIKLTIKRNSFLFKHEKHSFSYLDATSSINKLELKHKHEKPRLVYISKNIEKILKGEEHLSQWAD